MLHATTDHTTDQCRVLKKQAENMKATWAATSSTERAKLRTDKRNNYKKTSHEANEISSAMDKKIGELFETWIARYEHDFKRKRDEDDDSSEDEQEQNRFEANFGEEEPLNLDEVKVSPHESYSLSDLRRPNKRVKLTHSSPITTAFVNTKLGKSKPRKLVVLLDSGSSGSIILEDYVKKLRSKVTPQVNWQTQAGQFHTNKTCKVQFVLDEFFENRIIEWNLFVNSSPGPHRYDMIIGRDIMDHLGILLNFRTKQVTWDDSTINMKDPLLIKNLCDEVNEFYWHEEIYESQALNDATTRLKDILDAKYAPADLDKIVNECKYLSDDEQVKLKTLLERFEPLFDGTLGTWRDKAYNIELKPGATPYHCRPFPVPKIHERTLKVELDRLVKVGVLKKVNRSEWASPTFIIPKKDASVRFISDFRELNKLIKRKPFPIPKIQDLLLKLEGFQYATSLDLNMGYYHIELTPFSKRLCTIVTPFGKYEYQRLPMGLCNSPDIFQERMYELFSDLEYVRAYIDDLLVTSSSTFDDHLERLEKVLTRLSQAGLKVNAKKSHFCQSQVEYLGYWITRHGIKPLPKKVTAIQKIAPPKTRKQLRSFIGMINYYRDMWKRRSEILAPLTRLTSNTTPFRWTEVEQTAFDKIKQIVCREVLLAYPDFNRPFHIHTDASKLQLGAVIMQNNLPIAFYSRKLQPAQTRYTTTERELLSIVETLKEFKNILLGQQIVIHTDHQNLTHKNFNTERVLRWRLIIEEYSPTIEYIKGTKNVVADALSRLELLSDNDLQAPADCYGLDDEDLPEDAFPVSYQLLDREQHKDKTLLARLASDSKQYSLRKFRGGDKSIELIMHKNKIAVPQTLQKRVSDWYHHVLCHPGINRTEETIGQHFKWPKMREHITQNVSTCSICQRQKKQRKKYGYLPEKLAETQPWDRLCVDLIGPYTIKSKHGKKISPLRCVTMIDPATGWFEIAQYDDKKSITVSNVVETTWLTRYPRPYLVTIDRGSEFIGQDFRDMLVEDYGIKRKVISTRNPQANAIVERAHQTLGNLIRSFEVQDDPYIDENDPWSGILAATAFALRSTYHTTLQASPGQLVFGRDMILNIQHQADWTAIKKRKQLLIHKNNQIENSKRIPHTYCVGDLVMLENHRATKMETPYVGPYRIEQVNTNGTVRLRMGAVIDTINIRRIHPYRTSNSNRGGECNMRRAKDRR